jgi:inactivated superfamily I helicase
MAAGKDPNVYTIRPDHDFTQTLAHNILAGHLPHVGGTPPDELDLVNWTIFVPTRRAARALTMAFVDHGSTGTRLLPRIRPLGDADEDEIAAANMLSGLPELELKPAATALHRQFLLARLIIDWARENAGNALAQAVMSSTGQALALAHSLGKLIDGFENDQVDLSVIADLFGEGAANHEPGTVDGSDSCSRTTTYERSRRSIVVLEAVAEHEPKGESEVLVEPQLGLGAPVAHVARRRGCARFERLGAPARAIEDADAHSESL